MKFNVYTVYCIDVNGIRIQSQILIFVKKSILCAKIPISQ